LPLLTEDLAANTGGAGGQSCAQGALGARGASNSDSKLCQVDSSSQVGLRGGLHVAGARGGGGEPGRVHSRPGGEALAIASASVGNLVGNLPEVEAKLRRRICQMEANLHHHTEPTASAQQLRESHAPRRLLDLTTSSSVSTQGSAGMVSNSDPSKPSMVSNSCAGGKRGESGGGESGTGCGQPTGRQMTGRQSADRQMAGRQLAGGQPIRSEGSLASPSESAGAHTCTAPAGVRTCTALASAGARGRSAPLLERALANPHPHPHPHPHPRPCPHSLEEGHLSVTSHAASAEGRSSPVRPCETYALTRPHMSPPQPSPTAMQQPRTRSPSRLPLPAPSMQQPNLQQPSLQQPSLQQPSLQ